MDRDIGAQHPSTVPLSRDNNGWDGKLRLEKKAVVANAEILSDTEFSDEEAPPVEQIDRDEGIQIELLPWSVLISLFDRLIRRIRYQN